MVSLVADIHINTSEDKVFETNRLIELGSILDRDESDEVYLLGDIFDKSKPDMFDIIAFKELIDCISKPIYYIEGNHERVNAQYYCLDDIMGMFNIQKIETSFIGTTKIYPIGHQDIESIQYLDLSYKVNNVLLSHFRWSHPLFGKGELYKYESDIKNKFDIVFLGDIHESYEPEDNVIYIGSPYSNKYKIQGEHSYLLVNFEDLTYERVLLDLPNKLSITLPLSKLVSFLENIDIKHKYIIKVDIRNTDELKKLKKLVIPSCVTRLIPKIEKEEATKKEVVTKKDTIIDTLISILPKTIKKDEDYIRSILEN